MTKKMQDLQVGDRFPWIPSSWYGPCKLISIDGRPRYNFAVDGKVQMCDVYDLKFEAMVVNSPGVVYGVPGYTRVRILKQETKDVPN